LSVPNCAGEPRRSRCVVSQLVSVTRDGSGAIVDGSPEKVTEVTDVWTFARDVTSRDPNWKLVATEAGQ
jgi:predicted lipid-binding transport protein (Tim44 family)